MRVQAKIAHRFEDGSGNVIPFEEGEVKDLGPLQGEAALATGIFKEADDEDDGDEKAPEDEEGDPPPPAPVPQAPAAPGNVERLVAMTGQILSGNPDPDHLRHDGSPRFGAYHQIDPDFDFTEAEFREAWKLYREAQAED